MKNPSTAFHSLLSPDENCHKSAPTEPALDVMPLEKPLPLEDTALDDLSEDSLEDIDIEELALADEIKIDTPTSDYFLLEDEGILLPEPGDFYEFQPPPDFDDFDLEFDLELEDEEILLTEPEDFYELQPPPDFGDFDLELSACLAEDASFIESMFSDESVVLSMGIKPASNLPAYNIIAHDIEKEPEPSYRQASYDIFDGEPKGVYAQINNEARPELENTYIEADSSSSGDTHKKANTASYMLAYKDQDCTKVEAYYAYDKESEQALVERALDFFDRNCGYNEFTARWVHKDIHQNSDLVRVITANNKATSKTETLYVSSVSQAFSRYLSSDFPFSLRYACDCSNEPCFKEHSLSTFSDVEHAITALMMIGQLSFADVELQARGTTKENCARIAAIRLGSNSDSYGQFSYISGITSNDPIHTTISYSSKNGSGDYSSFSHIQRCNKARVVLQKQKETLPTPATPISQRVWVYGAMSNSSYYRLYNKRLLNPEILKHSILFSEGFLRRFIEISNKNIAIAIRRIAGAKDAYHIFLNLSSSQLEGKFRPKNVFELDLSEDSAYWSSSFSIIKTILEGWSNKQIRYDNWNEDFYQFDSMQGSYMQVASHWLFTLLVEAYFGAQKPRARTIRPVTTLQSRGFENVEVLSQGLISRRESQLHPRMTAKELSSQLFSFHLGYVQMSLGYSLFEMSTTEAGEEFTYSVFLSCDELGFRTNYNLLGEEESITIVKTNHEESITIVKTNHKDVVKTIWCIKDTTQALSAIKDIVLKSDIAKLEGMDDYDAMREIERTANSYGVEIKVGFNLLRCGDERSVTRFL